MCHMVAQINSNQSICEFGIYAVSPIFSSDVHMAPRFALLSMHARWLPAARSVRCARRRHGRLDDEAGARARAHTSLLAATSRRH